MRRNGIQRTARRLLSLLPLLAGAGCDGIFEVDNPNQLVQEDLARPEAAAALANGAEASAMRALGQLLLPLGAASDELRSIGSLDYGLELDLGYLTNASNDYTNGAFPFVAEARFMADEAIGRLEGFHAQGVLRTPADLARAYLYGGIVYTAIADAYDDFVLSDRRAAAPPVGEAAMVGLYDTAIGYLDRGLPLARATGRADLEVAILAQRARARHARGVWRLLNPRGEVPADPLVADEAAVADAESALRLVPVPDWRLQFRYGAATVGSQLGSQVNVRQEFRLDDAYVVPSADNRRVAGVRLPDPASGAPDPALAAAIAEFTEGAQYPPLTVVSARELHLILAEAALARGQAAPAAEHLDRVRALGGKEPAGGAIALAELLRHERRVNLFLQGRRLADQYRFGTPDSRWQAGSDARSAPGTFLPIAQIERLSNCHLVGSC